MSDAVPDPRERAGIIRDSLGVGIATGAYGVSFGAVSVAAGLSVAQTCALSLLMFTGASQFALVGVAATGGAPVSGAAHRAAARHPEHALRTAARSPARLDGLAADRRSSPAHRRVDGDVGHADVDAGRESRVPDHGPLDLRALEPVHAGRRGGRGRDRRPAHLRARRRRGRRVPRPALAAAARPAQPARGGCGRRRRPRTRAGRTRRRPRPRGRGRRPARRPPHARPGPDRDPRGHR